MKTTRKIIAAAALFAAATSAWAWGGLDPIISTQNDHGGEIILTSALCPDTPLFIAFIKDPAGGASGCGAISRSGESVNIYWIEENDARSYDRENFVVWPIEDEQGRIDCRLPRTKWDERPATCLPGTGSESPRMDMALPGSGHSAGR